MRGKIFQPKLIYSEGKFQEGKAVYVINGKIEAIENPETLKATYPESQVTVLPDMALLPGTVNIHNHSFQSLLRGIATDIPFLQWRDEALYKFSPVLTAEDVYKGAVFAFGEMMKYGVTTVTDFFYLHNEGIKSDEAIIRAAKDMGIRLVLARTMYDWNGAPKGYVETLEQATENTDALMAKYNGKDSMVSVVPAPHSLHAASLKMIEAGYGLAEKYNTKFHIHVAEEMFEVNDIMKEHGCRPMELFKSMGVLDKRMTAVHCVWLNENEKALMCAAGASLAYCPSSNMFLADGVTDIPYLKNGGVTVALGSDGACSNNRISIYEEIRMTALLQKVHKLDALCIKGPESFDMGTINGGKVLDMPLGKIEKGCLADFVAVDLNDISLQPLYNDFQQLIYNIVYSMQPSAIKRVIVNGEVTVCDGQILTIPEKEIVRQVGEVMDKFQKV